MNMYRYTQNDPVGLVDPLGLAPGDRFKTRDAAAVGAIDFIMAKSNKENREYGGWLYYNRENDYYSYVEAVPGEAGRINVNRFKEPCGGNEKAGIYHTHPGSSYNVGWFSTDDYLVASFRHTYIYLGTYSGVIKAGSENTGERRVRLETAPENRTGV